MFKWKETGTDIKRDEGLHKEFVPAQKVNTILKGSRVTGDITVSCDLELSGEVIGNITCEQGSNILIKGICRGSIKTDAGNATIEGELHDGDIIGGGDITITGKFNGGEIISKGRIRIDGEFCGRLEGNEIEIGANAVGKGELFYREFISISKGAKIEGQINKVQDEIIPKKRTESKVINMEFPLRSVKAE